MVQSHCSHTVGRLSSLWECLSCFICAAYHFEVGLLQFPSPLFQPLCKNSQLCVLSPQPPDLLLSLWGTALPLNKKGMQQMLTQQRQKNHAVIQKGLIMIQICKLELKHLHKLTEEKKQRELHLFVHRLCTWPTFLQNLHSSLHALCYIFSLTSRPFSSLSVAQVFSSSSRARRSSEF